MELSRNLRSGRGADCWEAEDRVRREVEELARRGAEDQARRGAEDQEARHIQSGGSCQSVRGWGHEGVTEACENVRRTFLHFHAGSSALPRMTTAPRFAPSFSRLVSRNAAVRPFQT